MAIQVLIATATRGYGELIQQTLIGAGGYRTALVASAQRALDRSEKIDFHLAILDSDLPDLPVVELAKRLLYILPDLRIIIIPPGDNLEIEDIESFHPDGFLSKPFYMPDLLKTIEEVLMGGGDTTDTPEGSAGKMFPWGKPVHPQAVGQGHSLESGDDAGKGVEVASGWEKDGVLSELPWLQDVDRAAQYLARMSLSSAALAALILRGDRLWASAGQLSQAATLELSNSVVAHKGKAGKRGRKQSDLVRFVHLDETGEDYLLYTTDLNEEFILALGFDSSMPFSEIRIQTGNLARALKSPAAVFESGEGDRDREQIESPQKPEEMEGAEIWDADEWEQGYEQDVQAPRHNGPLFAPEEVPPPTPEGQVDERYSHDDLHRDEEAYFDEEVGAYKAIPVSEVEDVNRALSVPDDPRRLSPVFQALYHITYACVLVPRLPNHRLSGDLSESLAEWVRQLSYAFNWRLEYLTVQPDYLLWVANTPPEMSPGKLMDSVREHTSERIFGEYPRYKRQNPSGDFWTPGYLILSGTQPPPADIVRAYVGQTRRLQGADW